MPNTPVTGTPVPSPAEPWAAWYTHLADAAEHLETFTIPRFADAAARDAAIPAPVHNQFAALASPSSLTRFDGAEWEQVFPVGITTSRVAVTMRGVGALAAGPGAHKMLNLDGSTFVVGQPFGPGVPYQMEFRGTAQFYGNTSAARVEVQLLARQGAGGWTQLFKRDGGGDKPAGSGDKTIVLETWETFDGTDSAEIDLVATISGAAVNWYADTLHLLFTRMR